MKYNNCLSLLILFFTVHVHSLELIADEELSEVTGQNGVSIAGEFSINETGGTLARSDTGNETDAWGTCQEKTDGVVSRCGGRIAVELNDTGGWVALDELKGSVSFQGVTLQSRVIDSVSDANGFGGDEADVGIDGMTVLEIGLPDKVSFESFSSSIVTSNLARPTDAGYLQQTRMGLDLNGSINMKGNLLLFPTGNP